MRGSRASSWGQVAACCQDAAECPPAHRRHPAACGDRSRARASTVMMSKCLSSFVESCKDLGSGEVRAFVGEGGAEEISEPVRGARGLGSASCSCHVDYDVQ